MIKLASLFLLIILLLIPLGSCLAFNLTNPLGNEEYLSPSDLYARPLKAVFGLLGVVALIFFIAGGFMWMTAAGNTERVTRARKILLYATLGMTSVLTAYVVMRFVIMTLIETTS